MSDQSRLELAERTAREAEQKRRLILGAKLVEAIHCCRGTEVLDLLEEELRRRCVDRTGKTGA